MPSRQADQSGPNPSDAQYPLKEDDQEDEIVVVALFRPSEETAYPYHSSLLLNHYSPLFWIPCCGGQVTKAQTSRVLLRLLAFPAVVLTLSL